MSNEYDVSYTLDLLLPVGFCCRCGMESRTYNAGNDERMCLSCARKEREVLEERLVAAQAENERLRTDKENLQQIIIHEAGHDEECPVTHAASLDCAGGVPCPGLWRRKAEQRGLIVQKYGRIIRENLPCYVIDDEDEASYEETIEFAGKEIRDLEAALVTAQAENERYGQALIKACEEIATLINNANDNKREEMGLKRLTSADVLPNFIGTPALRADDAGRVERVALLELIDDLRDEDACEYDHNDYCQTHYRGRPCAHERARAVLAAADGKVDP